MWIGPILPRFTDIRALKGDLAQAPMIPVHMPAVRAHVRYQDGRVEDVGTWESHVDPSCSSAAEYAAEAAFLKRLNARSCQTVPETLRARLQRLIPQLMTVADGEDAPVLFIRMAEAMLAGLEGSAWLDAPTDCAPPNGDAPALGRTSAASAGGTSLHEPVLGGPCEHVYQRVLISLFAHVRENASTGKPLPIVFFERSASNLTDSSIDSADALVTTARRIAFNVIVRTEAAGATVPPEFRALLDAQPDATIMQNAVARLRNIRKDGVRPEPKKLGGGLIRPRRAAAWFATALGLPAIEERESRAVKRRRGVRMGRPRPPATRGR
jgi:hypothetical protein